jgi:phage-related protein
MASIYDTILTWSSSKNYDKYDIVLGSDGLYYYSVIDSNSGPGNNPTNVNNLQTKWDGYIYLNSKLIPNFWWKPAYNAAAQFSPNLNVIQFGNGYQQRFQDGINSTPISFSLTFENRSEKETVSILHFLKEMKGAKSFIYNLPTILAKSNTNLSTKFICLSWKASFISYQNYSIDTSFIETPA